MIYAILITSRKLKLYFQAHPIEVINQIYKDWLASDDTMIAYRQELRQLESKFDGLRFSHVLREQNGIVDELSKMGSARRPIPVSVFLHVVDKPSVKFKTTVVEELPPTDRPGRTSDVMMVDVDWRDPFFLYLRSGMLPNDKDESLRLEIKARTYLLVDDERY